MPRAGGKGPWASSTGAIWLPDHTSGISLGDAVEQPGRVGTASQGDRQTTTPSVSGLVPVEGTSGELGLNLAV